MFHKFKITTCVFILCLFGLTLTPHAQPLAYGEGSQEFIDEFDRCKGKSKRTKTKMRERKNCFGRLARTAAIENMGGSTSGEMATRQTDFNSCKRKFCIQRGGYMTRWADPKDQMEDSECRAPNGHELTGVKKDKIKEAMHCYAAIARELYDILSD